MSFAGYCDRIYMYYTLDDIHIYIYIGVRAHRGDDRSVCVCARQLSAPWMARVIGRYCIALRVCLEDWR